MSFKKVKKEDSFAQWFINEFGVEKFKNIINHKKNEESEINIWEISKRSLAEIWFKCENKDYHEYSLSADKYYRGNRCKYCARTKYVHPKDSLGQYILDLLGGNGIELIWSDKNEKSPFEYSLGTEKKVWFKCLNGEHEDSFRQVKLAVRSDFKCSFCKNLNNISKLQNKVYNYISSIGYPINREHNCTIIPINPKTKYPLPFDNEVIELRLIIEVHGKQHYEHIGKTSKWLHNMTPEQFLYYRRIKDRYKKIFAKLNGYRYLEIPYWTDDKNETWKKEIDNIINVINNEGTTTKRTDHIY